VFYLHISQNPQITTVTRDMIAIAHMPNKILKTSCMLW